MIENKLMSGVALAYVGDAVFSLYVRTKMASEHDYKSGELTRICNRLVCARAQGEMFQFLFPLLDDQEAAVAKRCRNAHVPSKAKNVTMSDYKRATGLEGLLGYLYLEGKHERLSEIMRTCVDYYLNEETK